MFAARFDRILLLPFLLAASVIAADERIDFNHEIRPILSDCFHCHGGDAGSRKAGLRLDLRDAALKGGKSGLPAIVPGKPDESELLLRVASPHDDEVMPPPEKKDRLTRGSIDKLRQWIAQGAEYDAHWAFIPPKARTEAGTAPAFSHPIDRLVSARLAREKLTLSPAADPAALVRRIYLDVTGLPPSPAEVTAFTRSALQDRQQAVATLVDRLLGTEAYGQKWARHWLDVARYSDSNGYEKDLPRDQWVWRDWVIDAVNRDIPYDRFVAEQIAGDLLPGASQRERIATGFLRNSMINEEGAIVPEQFRIEEMFDRMDTLGKAVLGLTLQCAQCHTHKFDPISHDEYFGLFAFLNNTHEAQSWVYTAGQQEEMAGIYRVIAQLEEEAKARRREWKQEHEKWVEDIRAQQGSWTTLVAKELGSSGGLNHPTQEPDGSILTLGHRTTRGAVFAIGEPELDGVTGLRFEVLTHADLPFGGPGRSKYGTWAISELAVSVQSSGSTVWQPVKLVNATADFSETDAPLESEWAADFDKEKKRRRGPVAYLIDGDKKTGWRADRGEGRRNQESVAVVQFDCPLEYPAGAKLKIEWTTNHGGSDNGAHTTMVGRCRLALTRAPGPRALPVDYAAVLAAQTTRNQRTPEQERALFTAWFDAQSDLADLKAATAAAWEKFPAARTSVLHLAKRSPAQARRTHLLDRGAWDRPKHEVAPGTLAALHPFSPDLPRNRLGLARWLVDPRSPLTARVAVNRIWQAIFGAGLVESSEDFGIRAPVPEHLDLLDWLAVDFMAHGWSQKRLIRTILTSATYGQASHVSPELLERDPRNRLLARGPRFRLEAEVIRDAALGAAGLLELRSGGPSIFPPVPQSVLDYNYTKPDYWIPAEGADRYRRAVYVFRKRSMPDPVLSSFDSPNGDTSCARRVRSNTPLAALTNLNEPVFVEAAQALAVRILREGGRSDAERADYAYRICTARGIRPAEWATLSRLLRETRTRLAEGWLSAREIATRDSPASLELPPNTNPQDAAAWTVVARVLLNLDEVVTKP